MTLTSSISKSETIERVLSRAGQIKPTEALPSTVDESETELELATVLRRLSSKPVETAKSESDSETEEVIEEEVEEDGYMSDHPPMPVCLKAKEGFRMHLVNGEWVKMPKRTPRKLYTDGNVAVRAPRKPRAPKVDEEGNVIKPKRAPRKPKVDADGNVVKPKRAPRKPNEVSATVAITRPGCVTTFSDSDNEEEGEEVEVFEEVMFE